MTVSQWEALIDVPREALGTLAQFVPDTPWTTTTFQAARGRKATVHADAPHLPRNFVARVPGGDTPEDFDRAYVFGSADNPALRAHVAGVSSPTEFVVDEDLAPMLQEVHPDASTRDSVCCWFDRLASTAEAASTVPVRRLRVTEIDALEQLVRPSAFRAFESTKEMVLAGGCFAAEVGGAIASVAYVADQSVKYARIGVHTVGPLRRKGLGFAAARRLMEHCANDGRLVCGLVPRRDAAAMHFMMRLGFPQKALLRTYVVVPKPR